VEREIVLHEVDRFEDPWERDDFPALDEAEWRRWEADRRRAVRRAVAEVNARRGRRGPCDLLGEPLDLSPAGRRKAWRAHFVATGYLPVHPALLPGAGEEWRERADDLAWAALLAPQARRATA
jgi:hypothetical protein